MKGLELKHEAYTVGWVCTLAIEQSAAFQMLDERHKDLRNPATDHNAYTLGRIGKHNVVIAGLPRGRTGNNNSATVAARMASTFPNIKFVLIVGVGGGTPEKTRLGDVVISCPNGKEPGVVQWDIGKVEFGGQSERTGCLSPPPTALLTSLAKFEADQTSSRTKMRHYLDRLISTPGIGESFLKPDSADVLYHPEYRHISEEEDCSLCDTKQIVKRKPRRGDMMIHCGLIASGNQKVKDANLRDKLYKEFNDNVLCIEMEAAGLMDDFPCIVIRGICDYADSHANDDWKDYAAAVSAACAKAFLGVVPEHEVLSLQPALQEKLEARDCLRDLFLTDPFEDKKALKHKKGDPAQGTCEWILGTEELSAWIGSRQIIRSESQAASVLWLHGNPGTGKSTTAIFLTEALSTMFSMTVGKTLAYYFCDSGFENRRTATSVIRGLLFQLVQQHPQLLDYLLPKYNEHGRTLFESFNALWKIFMAAAADQNTGQKYFIIDALDECDQESQDVLLWQFRETFQSQDVPSNIKILITSRPYPQIYEYLNIFINKDLLAFPQAKEDINQCIEKRVANLTLKKHYTDTVKQEVSKILKDKAEGISLWVGLACEELEKVPSKDAIQVLQDMPKGLHSLYKRLLDAIQEGKMLLCATENGHKSVARPSQSQYPTNPQTDEDIIDIEALQGGPPTDSGYASITREKNDRTKYVEAENDAQSTGNIQIQFPNERELLSTVNESILSADDLESDDARTVYSDAPSLSDFKKENYIYELADKLLSIVPSEQLDDQMLERISTILPELLKAFALKVGHNAPTQMHRDVMVFIHRHRRIPDVRDQSSDGMPLNDKMSLWYQKSELEESAQSDPNMNDSDETNLDSSLSQGLKDNETESSEEEETDQTSMQDFAAYQDFILNSPAFQWLLENLNRQFHLAPSEPDIMMAIGREIIRFLPSHRVSRKNSSKAYKMTFEVDWDPVAFFKEQKYKEESHKAIELAIVLTGSDKDAQALTCAQYLSQTWPSTGERIMRLVKGILRKEPDCQETCVLSDGTRLTARICESRLLVEASGIGPSVAEVGEQLAWLGAALRSSTYEQGIACCIPSITWVPKSDSLQQEPGTLPLPDINCRINFLLQKLEGPRKLSNGQCWHNMFRNPVVVKGYPIKRRGEAASGLEIPLNIMAGLAQTQRIDTYNNKIFIKGFSTMLIPTMHNGDMLLWHLLYKEDGSRISYLDDSISRAEDITINDLEDARHILGWCSEVKFYAGAVDANYAIDPSDLDETNNDCALRNAHASIGRLITGTQYCIGIKDTPLRISRSGDGYILMLVWLATRFVILWDEEDKRGWLVSGTSALLHLIRAFLVHRSTGIGGEELQTKNDDIQEEVSDNHTADSAAKILTNNKNRELRIYPEKDTYIVFEDQVRKFFIILEKLFDYQDDIAGMDGRNLGNLPLPRKYLEGWDFTDPVRGVDPFYPRVATLETIGKGWVDFTRGIPAVTLFGRGFGDIIQPASATMCEYWAVLPKQKYYLATSMNDLQRIIRNSTKKTHPRKLNNNILWHNPSGIPQSCQCSFSTRKSHCNPVQILFPSSFSNTLPAGKEPLKWEGNGAIIFGHNDTFKWFWTDVGNPKEGELPPSSEEPETTSDSGIGTSLILSISEHTWSTVDSNSRLKFRSRNGSQLDSKMSAAGGFQEEKAPTVLDYGIGIICALSEELFAVRALLDENHQRLSWPAQDDNHYALGRIGEHNVVTACLPENNYGTNSAATVASDMKRTFPKIRFCLLVGIGGGIPSEENDIRLGDVVVGTSAGIIQHDLGKVLENASFKRMSHVQQPPKYLMTAISMLRSDTAQSKLQDYIDAIENCDSAYRRPPTPDRLFVAEYIHPEGERTCQGCDQRLIKKRRPRSKPRYPSIHYGLIASGNQVIKNAKIRDRLYDELDAVCVEMEAAGVVEAIPCLVIRGICDYADSHKNDLWHKYAAATAAAYTKVLLSSLNKSNDSGNSLNDLGNSFVLKRPRSEDSSSRNKYRRI